MDAARLLPDLAAPTLAEGSSFALLRRAYLDDRLCELDARVAREALVELVVSGDPESGAALRALLAAGVPTECAEAAIVEPLAITAARQWESPAYVDMLATLLEFHADFEETTPVHTVSARALVESRAPGVFPLLVLKARLVASGGWQRYVALLAPVLEPGEPVDL